MGLSPHDPGSGFFLRFATKALKRLLAPLHYASAEAITSHHPNHEQPPLFGEAVSLDGALTS